MIYWILAGWLACSVVGYAGIRIHFWQREMKWMISDREYTVFCCLAFAPLFVWVVMVMLFAGLFKFDGDDKPARW